MASEKSTIPIRFGIIGCANIARKVSRAILLAPNSSVISVGSRSADKARQFVADNALPPSTHVHGSYEGVLDDPEVDAIYVPLPTSLHVKWAVAAAEKGKHVKMAEQSNPIRFGIIGCASIAHKLSRAIQLAPNSSVIAVGSRSADKARQFIADTALPPSTHVHGSYEGVLDDPEVDAVYVPLPTSLHVKWAVAAAEKGKHVLLEKPTALCVADLDEILGACERKGVQFMDATMWMHHPRTAKMKELLSDSDRFGELRTVSIIFSVGGKPDFLKNDIRVKPDLDAVGALGAIGWYCVRAILWSADYELPKTAIGIHGTVKNEAGVILSCGSSLLWENGKVATFHCSFLGNLTIELCVVGSKGTLHLSDYAIPFEETSAAFFFTSNTGFKNLTTGWEPLPSKHMVTTDLPQEALMVKEFARLAGSIRDSSAQPDKSWPTVTRKTQLVLDAVKASIDNGFKPMDIAA